MLHVHAYHAIPYELLSYSTVRGKVLDCLHFIWGVDRNLLHLTMSYYQIIHHGKTNILIDIKCRRFELQPTPDYLRWYKIGELQFLPMEEPKLFLKP